MKRTLTILSLTASLAACQTVTLPAPIPKFHDSPYLLEYMDNHWRSIAEIQRKGNYYYRIDRKVQNSLYGNSRGDIVVNKPFHVLPYNSPASCTNEVAIKIDMIRKQMPAWAKRTGVIIYDQPIGDTYYPHAAVIIERVFTKGFVILNNQSNALTIVDTLDAYRNHKIMTYEQALRIYGKKG